MLTLDDKQWIFLLGLTPYQISVKIRRMGQVENIIGRLSTPKKRKSLSPKRFERFTLSFYFCSGCQSTQIFRWQVCLTEINLASKDLTTRDKSQFEARKRTVTMYWPIYCSQVKNVTILAEWMTLNWATSCFFSSSQVVRCYQIKTLISKMYNSNVSILVTCAVYLPIDSVKELN